MPEINWIKRHFCWGAALWNISVLWFGHLAAATRGQAVLSPSCFFFFSFTLLSANFNRVIWLTKGRNKVLCHLYLLFIKCVSQWKDNVSSGNLVCSIACNHESGVTSLEHRAPYTIHMITHSCSSPVSSTLSSGPPPLRLLQRYYYFLLLSLWNHQQI